MCVFQKPHSDSDERVINNQVNGQGQQQKVEQLQQQQQSPPRPRRLVNDIRPPPAANHPATQAVAAADADAAKSIEKRSNRADINERPADGVDLVQEQMPPNVASLLATGKADLVGGGDQIERQKQKNTEELLSQSELVKRDERLVALPRAVDDNKVLLSTLPPPRALRQDIRQQKPDS